MMRRTAILILATTLAAGSLAAQQGGVNLRLVQGQPAKYTQPLCPLKAINAKVDKGINSLKKAFDAKAPADRSALLADARMNLLSAISQESQATNGAAWYYLGRVALMQGDAAGADSAFTKAQDLVPSCEIDIAQYRQNNWALLGQAGIEFMRGPQVKPGMVPGEIRRILGEPDEITTSRTGTAVYDLWRYGSDTFIHLTDNKVEMITESAAKNSRPKSSLAGKSQPDSALAQFRDASLLFRGLPHVYSNMGVVFANVNHDDSAAVYFAKALAIAEKDTTLVEDRNGAAVNLAIMYQRLSRNHEAIDILHKYLGWKPDDSDAQKELGRAFRNAGIAFSAKAAADSAKAIAFSAKAMTDSAKAMAYRAKLAADSAKIMADSATAVETAMVTRFSKTNLDSLDNQDLMSVGVAAFNAAKYPEAQAAFAKAVKRNPWSRDARYNLANTYLAMKDNEHLIEEATKLLDIEPMNEDALRLLAQGQRALKRDEAVLKTAERLVALPFTVEVSLFQIGQSSAKFVAEAVGRSPQDPTGKPLKIAPLTLVVEFVDLSGAVIDSKEVPIPALASGQKHPIQVDAKGTGIMSWRYRQKVS